ncbi:antitoxin [Streptomyces sp. NPDC058735]|uniref:antitoxin n=1 Tax=unclassified Streptomyces TaxID=2593676 RepID=UPI00368437B5
MGLLDTMKARLGPAKSRVSDLAQRNEGRIHHGLDKAAHAVDRRTKGKYSGKIQSGAGRAKDAMGRFAHKGESGPDASGTTPPPGTVTPPPEAGRTAPPRDASGGTPPDDAPPPVS